MKQWLTIILKSAIVSSGGIPLSPLSPGRGQWYRRGHHPAVAAATRRHFGAARGARILRGRGLVLGELWLVGGLEHFLFSHILGIIIPID